MFCRSFNVTHVIAIYLLLLWCVDQYYYLCSRGRPFVDFRATGAKKKSSLVSLVCTDKFLNPPGIKVFKQTYGKYVESLLFCTLES